MKKIYSGHEEESGSRAEAFTVMSKEAQKGLIG